MSSPTSDLDTRYVVRPGGLRTDRDDDTVSLEWFADGVRVVVGPSAASLVGEFALPRSIASLCAAQPDPERRQDLERSVVALVDAGVLVDFRTTSHMSDVGQAVGVFGLPVRTLAEATNLGADTVVLGVPTDSGTTYRPGARFAPQVVRQVSRSVLSLSESDGGVHSATRDGGFLRGRRIADIGDACTPATYDPGRLRNLVATVVRAGLSPALIGGDHSVSLSAIEALCEVGSRPVGVLHLDAHHDYGRPRGNDDPTPVHHGNFLDRVVGHPRVEAVISLGVRQFTARAPDPHPVRVVWPGETVFDATPERVFADLPRGLDWYLTIDIDVLDPSMMPATGTPVPGGWSVTQLLEIVRIAGHALDVVALDVVEFLPGSEEWPGITVAHVLAYAIDALTPPEGNKT